MVTNIQVCQSNVEVGDLNIKDFWSKLFWIRRAYNKSEIFNIQVSNFNIGLADLNIGDHSNGRLLLDLVIKVLFDSKAEIAWIRKVLSSELVFLDSETWLKFDDVIWHFQFWKILLINKNASLTNIFLL